MQTSRRLLYPEPLSVTLPSVDLDSNLQKIHEFGTAQPMAYRIPLLFSVPAQVVIKIESVLGSERGWLRAGSLAQILYPLPGDPKKQVNRLYLDDAFFKLDGAGHAYYLEFWALRWLKDYYLEIWAQTAL